MENVIVAFPRIENAKSIRTILVRGGFSVRAVCTSGAHALVHANELDSGILICPVRLCDTTYSELYQDLPRTVRMLLLTTQQGCLEGGADDIVRLAMPLKVPELLHVVGRMEEEAEQGYRRRRRTARPRTQEEQRLVQEAKELLMQQRNLSEEEAHRYLQKTSMDSGTGMSKTAQQILQELRESEASKI